MSGIILGGLPLAVGSVLVIVNPSYMTPLLEDPIGNFLLLYCAASYGIGVFVMRDMTKVEV